MDNTHLRAHLQDLRGRLHFLRTLRPDSDRYKLWLGDWVELINVAHGLDSPEMTALRAILTSRPRGSDDAVDAASGERAYLDRLDAFATLLDSYDRAASERVLTVERNGEQR